jgi:hypothetical protein
MIITLTLYDVCIIIVVSFFCSLSPRNPSQNSSTNLTNNFKYEKSVETMLDEAAQMRADLEAKRAAEGGSSSGKQRFGKKKNKK